MLRALLNRLTGKSSSRKTGARPKAPRRTVLTLEALEKRELLSANVPGFSLNNGNLYNTAAQARLIDTGVQNVALPGDGNIYVERANHDLLLESPSGQQLLDFGQVSQFAMSADGTLYALDQLGGLWRYRPTGGLSQIAEGVSSFQVAGDGTLYYLQGGGLFGLGAQINGQLYNGYNVTSYQTSSDGSVYWLGNYGGLTYLCGYGKYAHGQIAEGVSSFQVAGDGTLYYLQGGTLFNGVLVAQGQSGVVSPGVASFAVGGDGNLYYYQTISNCGDQYGMPVQAAELTEFNTTTSTKSVVGSNIQSWQMGPDGRIYFLTYVSWADPGTLYMVGSAAGKVSVGSGVASFAIRGDGNLYLLHTNFDLTLNSPNGNQLQDFGVVQSFALGGDGNAYYLLLNGDLCHDTHPSETLHDIRSFAVGTDGSLDVLTRGGYLSRNGVLIGHTHLVIFPLYSVNAFVAAIVLDPAIQATPIQWKEAGAFTGLGTAYQPSAFPFTLATTPASYWATPQGMAESMQSVVQGVLDWASQSASVIVGLSVGVISGEFGNSIKAAANALVDSVLSDQAIKGIVANVVPADEAEQAEEGVALIVAAATLSTGNLYSTFASLLLSPTVIDGLSDFVLDISLPIYNQVYNTSLSRQPVGGAGGSGGGVGNGGGGGGGGLWGGASTGQNGSDDGSNSLTGSF